MSVDFFTRAAMVGLASYAVVSTAAAIAAWAAWRRLMAIRGSASPQQTAARLFAARLSPSALGLSAAIVMVSAFVLFEPNLDRETVGYAVLIPALLGAALLASSATRIALALRASARLRRLWHTPDPVHVTGCPVEILRADTVFPVVALAGWIKPRLIVASRVLDACSPAELRAVIAHELAHLESRDNLRRAALAVCPDVLAGSRAARDMEHAWAEASELAADDRAAGATATSRLDLASALVKVARLGADVPAPPLPASALFRGEPIADRVRRLLSPPPAPPPARRWIAPAMAVAAGIATMVAFASMPYLFNLVEAAIRLGR
jgi:Zn-dependent protease with chaperone function